MTTRINLLVALLGMSLVMMLSLLWLPPVEAAPKSKDSYYDIYFKKWFLKYFSVLYYSRTLTQLEPYFSHHFTDRWKTLTPDVAVRELDNMKVFYVSKPKLKSVKLSPGAKSADVKIKGYVAIKKEKKQGKGEVTFHMINTKSGWKIDGHDLAGEFLF